MDIKELILFLKLLADESRLRIVHLLSRQSISVGDLCTVLNMNQSAVSKHLVKLRLMGVVTDAREGSFVIYSLNDQNAKYQKVIRFFMKHFSMIDTLKNDWDKMCEITRSAQQ